MAFSCTSLGMPGGVDFLFQLVEFVLFAAPEFLVDGLEFLIEVVLFLRALHLPLHARVDAAIDVELFEFAFEDVRDAVEPVENIEIFEQFLLFLDRNLQVRGNRVGELGGIIHAGCGDHGVVIHALRELDVLLEEPVDAAGGLVKLRGRFGAHRHRTQHGAVKAFFTGDLYRFGALDTLDQHANVAVRQLHALNDIGQRAHGENFFGLGIVDRGVMLGGEENLFFAGQRFFEGAHRCFAADDKRLHHLRKNDHIPHRHHRNALQFIFFTAEHDFLGSPVSRS